MNTTTDKNKEAIFERFRAAATRNLDAIEHCHHAMRPAEVEAYKRMRILPRNEWSVKDMNSIIGANHRINNPIVK